jgi:hypothetical protein
MSNSLVCGPSKKWNNLYLKHVTFCIIVGLLGCNAVWTCR